MFVHHRTRGVTLKKVDRGEADQLFTVYTESFGKIKVVGKAIRKICSKLRAGMETFYFSEIEFIQGKYYKILTDALQIEKFLEVHRDLKRRTIAQRVVETLDALIKGQEKERRIWGLLKNTLALLVVKELPDKNRELIYHYFFWRLVSILGYQPELFQCPGCKKKLHPKGLHFNSQAGGVVCKRCSSRWPGSIKANAAVVKMIRMMIAGDKKTLCNLKIEKEHLELLNTVSEDYLSFIMETNN